MNNLIYQYFIADDVIPKYCQYSWNSVFNYSKHIKINYISSKKKFFNETDYLFFKKIFKRNDIQYHYEILRLFYDKYFDQFDNILYIDSDILISKKAPNIFEHFESGVMAALEQSKFLNLNKINLDLHSIQLKFKKFNIPPIVSNINKNKLRILNSGFLLIDKESRLNGRLLFDNWKEWLIDFKDNKKYKFTKNWHIGDEVFLTAMFNKYEFNFIELDNIWNRIADSKEILDSYVMHFSNFHKNNLIDFYERHQEKIH